MPVYGVIIKKNFQKNNFFELAFITGSYQWRHPTQ